MYKSEIKNQKSDIVKGFTLIELLIYLGLLVLIGAIITAFLPNLLRTNSYAQKKEAVVDSTQRALELINQEIHHATSIYTPTSVFDTHPGQLSLATARNTPAGETTTYVDFYLDNERLYIKREGTPAKLIIPDKIRISNLTFQQLNTSGSIPAVRVRLDATYDSPSGELIQRTQSSLSTTASLRSY